MDGMLQDDIIRERRVKLHDTIFSDIKNLIASKKMGMEVVGGAVSISYDGPIEIRLLIEQKSTKKQIKVKLTFRSVDKLFSESYYLLLDVDAGLADGNGNRKKQLDPAALARVRILRGAYCVYRSISTMENELTIPDFTASYDTNGLPQWRQG